MPSRAIWLRTVLRNIGVEVGDHQLETLDAYVALLLEWNKKVNLISRKDEENVWENHLLHSLSALARVEIPPGAITLDLGTGGGLPGIPLKILRPDTEFTLLDSIQKKITAVRDIVEKLALTGMTTLCGRAEELGRKGGQRGKYDLVLSRGVTSLPHLVRLANPLLRHRSVLRRGEMGRMGAREKRPLSFPALLAFKGGPLEAELTKAKRVTTTRCIEVLNLEFAGREGILLEGKKLVVVEL